MRSLTTLLLLALCFPACSEEIQHGLLDGAGPGADGAPPTADGLPLSPDAGVADQTPGEAAGAPTLSIYIRGDTTAHSFSDGYAGQTPTVYTMGLGRFDIMTSANDPAPVTVFDHGAQPVEVDLLKETLGGQAAIDGLPAASYTHGRVLLTSASFTVQATVHAGVALPGPLKVVAALSDTTIDGSAWTKGKVTFGFAGQTVPGVLPALPSTGGGTVVEEAGKTWLVFPFPKPIKISPTETKSHRATIVYQVFESFRWEDQTQPDYQDNVFDASPLVPSWEPVKSFGATGYSIELD